MKQNKLLSWIFICFVFVVFYGYGERGYVPDELKIVDSYWQVKVFDTIEEAQDWAYSNLDTYFIPAYWAIDEPSIPEGQRAMKYIFAWPHTPLGTPHDK